jgi:hypothetical protein
MYFVLDGSVLVHAVKCLVTIDDKLLQNGTPSAKEHKTTLNRRTSGTEGSSSNLGIHGRGSVAGEHIVSKGDIFGEGGLFPSELGDWRQENATALSWVSAYALSAAAMREIAAVYPEVSASACMPICRSSMHSPSLLCCLTFVSISAGSAIVLLSFSAQTIIAFFQLNISPFKFATIYSSKTPLHAHKEIHSILFWLHHAASHVIIMLIY